MAIHQNVDDALKDLRKKKRELKTKERELKAEQALERNMDKWKKIIDVQQECRAILAKADLGMRMTLTKLDRFPDYYIYQHPVNKKLKTANRKELWVQQYLGEKPIGERGGLTGVEADLLATARKTRISAWKRANAKKKRVEKVLSQSATKKGGSGKDKAVGSVGVG